MTNKTPERELITASDFIFTADPQKTFKKLAAKQFSRPFDSIRELIANAIDSYIGTDEQITLDITSKGNTFEITDTGTGLNDYRMEVLRTLGLTDKTPGQHYIGRFGIGFASLFHPDLRVKKIVIDTSDGKEHRELVFRAGRELPSLSIYRLDTPRSRGTTIRVTSKDKKFGDRAQYDAKQTTLYLPYTITLNGERVKTETIQTDGKDVVYFNENGIEGHVKYLGDQEDYPDATFLSHYLRVDSKSMSEILKDKSWKHIARAKGIVNSDDLSLVVSRNELIEDQHYTRAIRLVQRASHALFDKLIDWYEQEPTEDVRKTLAYKLCACAHHNRELLDGRATDPAVERLKKLPVIKIFGREAPMSLEELITAKDIHGCILGAEDEKDLEPYRQSGYRAPAIDIESAINGRLRRYSGHDFDPAAALIISILDGYNVSDIDAAGRDRLKRLGIYDPYKLIHHSEPVALDCLSRSEIRFITSLRHLFTRPEITNVLQKYKIPRTVQLEYGKYTRAHDRTSVLASYNPVAKKVTINHEHQNTKTFTRARKSPTAAALFIPLMAHELVHDELAEHTEEFYIKKGKLERDLKRAVMQYLQRKDERRGDK